MSMTVSLRFESFGQAVRTLRTAARMSRDQTARKAGISPTSLTNYEQGLYQPRPEGAWRIVEVLAEANDLDVAELWSQVWPLLWDVPPAGRLPADSDTPG